MEKVASCDFAKQSSVSYCYTEAKNMIPVIDLQKIIADNIRSRREEIGLTQIELGLKIGVKEEYAQIRISQYETGKRSPGKATLKKLAAALETDMERLVNIFSTDRLIISDPTTVAICNGLKFLPEDVKQKVLALVSILKVPVQHEPLPKDTATSGQSIKGNHELIAIGNPVPKRNHP